MSDEEVVVEIETGSVTGTISPRALSLIQEWRERHKEELMADWKWGIFGGKASGSGKASGAKLRGQTFKIRWQSFGVKPSRQSFGVKPSKFD